MDRFDPRWDDDRDRTQSADRDWGGRSGRDPDDPCGGHDRGPFTRDLDLPGGDERQRVRSRGRDYDLCPDEVSRFLQDRPGEPHGEAVDGAAKNLGSTSDGRT
jgi:hypothetical protein